MIHVSDASPVVDEVRERRMQISAAFGHDLGKYGEHLMQLQKRSEYQKLLVRLADLRQTPHSENSAS